LLVVDEVHLIPTTNYSKIFDCVSYKLILCLTGTLERLDGKEILIKKHAPVCDEITMKEALDNGVLLSDIGYIKKTLDRIDKRLENVEINYNDLLRRIIILEEKINE
jgi:superfamily II DNA or RNA helicase